MDLEVNTEELRQIEVDLKKSTDMFKSEVDLWEKEIDNLKNIWKGVEADIFYDKCSIYFSKLKMVIETKNKFSEVINDAYDTYEKCDIEFKNKLKQENLQYEGKKDI